MLRRARHGAAEARGGDGAGRRGGPVRRRQRHARARCRARRPRSATCSTRSSPGAGTPATSRSPREAASSSSPATSSPPRRSTRPSPTRFRTGAPATPRWWRFATTACFCRAARRSPAPAPSTPAAGPQQTTLEIAWRHRTARTCRFADPHRVDLPVLADMTLETGGCGHFTCIPIDEHTLRIERIDYSRSPEGGADGAERIEDYVARRRWHDGEPRKAESSSRPVALGGDFAAFWRIGGARVAKLGARGGFSHPFTGSALPDALRTGLALARQSDLSGLGAARSVRGRSGRLVEAPRIPPERQPAPARQGRPGAGRPVRPRRAPCSNASSPRSSGCSTGARSWRRVGG